LDQGVVSNSKAYYLDCTFKQLKGETDGEDKQSSRQFWKDYNIMNAIYNIRGVWNELTPNCQKAVASSMQQLGGG
jgi:hypothetical protein